MAKLAHQRRRYPIRITGLPGVRLSFSIREITFVSLALVALVELLLGFRFYVLLHGYRLDTDFIHRYLYWTGFLLLPFDSVARGSLTDVPYIEWSILVAMLAYPQIFRFLAWAIIGDMVARKKLVRTPARNKRAKPAILRPRQQRSPGALQPA